jgi:hypothetical protein
LTAAGSDDLTGDIKVIRHTAHSHLLAHQSPNRQNPDLKFVQPGLRDRLRRPVPHLA